MVYFLSRNNLDSPKGFHVSRVNTEGELSGKPVFLNAVNSNSDMYGRPMRWTSGGEVIILEVFFNHKTYALSLKNGQYQPVRLHPSLLWQPEPMQWLADGKHLCLPSGDDRQPGLLNVETGELTAVPISIPEGFQLGASTFSPDGTRIAFVQQKFAMTPQGGRLFESGTLHVTSVSGGPSMQLTHGNVAVGQPRWSPDGQRIAFLNVKGGGKAQLCVVSAGNGKVKRLSAPGIFGGVAWSPDGKTLAFLRLMDGTQTSQHAEFEGDVYVAPATSGASKRITHTPELEMPIGWTPDGKGLILEIRGEKWVASLDDEKQTKLRSNYIRSSWSSDGKSYLVSADLGKFQRVSLDGSTSSELSASIPVTGHPLCMSPNGEIILFSHGDPKLQCWRIDASRLTSQ